MTTSKKTPVSKKPSATRTAKPAILAMQVFFTRAVSSMQRRVDGLLARRPHRSFRRTRRRDYIRPLTLPGYWAFTNQVRKTLMKNKTTFLGLVIFYGVLSIILVGLASQANYTTLSDTLRTTTNGVLGGNWDQIGQASILLLTGVTGGFNSQLSETQQIYAIILLLLTWLTSVWLLRAQLQGGKPRLREGIYAAGAPIISTFIVLVIMVIQLLPVAFAAAGFAAAVSTGALSGGAAAMTFCTVALLLLALSLYWITSTFIALIVVTLPGMYPLHAVKIAGDLVVGRRLRILLRLSWLAMTVALTWIIVMVPVILFDTWLKGLLPNLSGVPTIPAVLLTLTSFTVTWVAGYIYLLYRKVVDDDAAPA